MAGEDQLFQRFGREFPKGHVLFREGESGSEMYVVQSGKVNITKRVRETEKILATLGAGEFFGEMSILNNKPRSAGAVMAEQGKLLVIDPRTFEAMIRGNVEIAVRLIKKLSERLQEADEQIANLLMRDPASRVIHFLLQNGKRAKDTPKGKLVPVDPAELHGRMGLSAAEVSEAIEKVARARIIQVVDGAVLVPDWNKMEKYLEFLEMKERFGDT
jgi:CRP/FNR family transcriptional regulator, cyclic AMP receptor protein